MTLDEAERLLRDLPFGPPPYSPAAVGTLSPAGVEFLPAEPLSADAVATLGMSVREDAAVDLPMRWDGAPAKSALGRLRRESWCAPFDVDRAAEIVRAMWCGLSFTRACASVDRVTAMAWRRLVPEFDALVVEAEKDLGSFWRDSAAEEEDPAMMRAKLALAASYDARIKGSSEAAGAVVNVTVVDSWGG